MQSSSPMQLLRTIAVAAMNKIEKNRFKDRLIPNKWHPEGVDPVEGRTWKLIPRYWLLNKFAEEVGELRDAVSTGEPATECLNEGGDVLAMSMMVLDREGLFDMLVLAPHVVTLCGSTKFREAYEEAQYKLTMEGKIVLTVGFYHHVDNTRPELIEAEKVMLDVLHKRKIDISDSIYVVNVGGYIGSSTASEIAYATSLRKPVYYLEPVAVQESANIAA